MKIEVINKSEPVLIQNLPLMTVFYYEGELLLRIHGKNNYPALFLTGEDAGMLAYFTTTRAQPVGTLKVTP